MKKICHITTVHPIFDNRIFHKEAKTLVNAGYDVRLIARHDKDEAVDGVKIIALPKAKNRFQRILFQIVETNHFPKIKRNVFYFT